MTYRNWRNEIPNPGLPVQSRRKFELERLLKTNKTKVRAPKTGKRAPLPERLDGHGLLVIHDLWELTEREFDSRIARTVET